MVTAVRVQPERHTGKTLRNKETIKTYPNDYLYY